MNLLPALLEKYQPIDEADRKTLEEFRRFVISEPECFERSFLYGHVTGSCFLVDREGTRLLLTHHRKLQKWIQLGGHADGDKDILAVAQKEAKEESGLSSIVALSEDIFDLDVHLIPQYKDVPAHYHYDVRFLLQAEGSDEFLISDESLDLAWVPLAHLENYSQERSLLRMKRKWQLWCERSKI